MSSPLDIINSRPQTIKLHGMQPRTLQKFEETVVQIAASALEEYSPAKKIDFNFDWEKLSENLQNANIKIKFKGSSGFDRNQGMSTGVKVLGGLASLAVGTVAFKELGTKSILLADQADYRETLQEFKGRLNLLEELHENNEPQIKVIEQLFDIHDTAQRILNRAQRSQRENTLLIGSVGLNALFAFVGFSASPALVPVAVIGGGLTILGAAFKWGLKDRVGQIQFKEAQKMASQIEALKAPAFREIKKPFVSISKRSYTTAVRHVATPYVGGLVRILIKR